MIRVKPLDNSMRSLDELIEDVYEIDWSDLQHAYGEASDVPDMLRGLLSEDVDVRLHSLYSFSETIWHQGTVYEASPHMIPFLLEMLKSPQVPGKSGFALLVAELVDGVSSPDLFANHDDPLSNSFREYLKQAGRDFDRELKNGRSYVKAIPEAVDPEIGLLFEYLKDDEPGVRESVARALSNFHIELSRSFPLLEDVNASETEQYVADAIEASIAELESHQ